MSQFTYQPYHSPYVTTIAELMMEPGRAQAQAAVQSGNAWANAANQIGQTVAAMPQQIQQAKAQQVQTDLHGLQLSDAQKAAQFRDALSTTLKNTPQLSEDGVSVYDLPSISKSLADQGFGAYTGDVVKNLSGLNDAFRNEKAAKLSLVRTGAQSVIAAGNDPTLALHFLDQLEANHSYSKDEIDQYRAFIQQDPANVAKLTAALAGPQKLGTAQKGSTIYNETTGATVATVPNDPDEGAYTINGQRFRKDGTPIGALVPTQTPPKSLQTKSVLLDGKPAEVIFDPASGQFKDPSGADVTARVKPIPAASLTIHNENAKAPNLPAWALDDSRPTGPDANKLDPSVRMTPNGLYQAALNNLATGQFPPTGRGSDPASVATRTAITSKVGAIAASAGMDEPALRAFYKSNAASLTQQQKLYDSAQSNITTADRNVAELDKVLAKLPDTGSPLFNQPLRAFAKNVEGDRNMGPIATYLASVQNEYGKIVNSSNGSAVLTDSARHEAQQLIDPNATVAQMLGSIQALKTEGGNRLLSIGEQIQRIQQRMQGGGATPAAASTPAGVTVTSPSGKPYTFPSQADADRAVAAAKEKGLWK